jgi:competence protein ComEC
MKRKLVFYILCFFAGGGLCLCGINRLILIVPAVLLTVLIFVFCRPKGIIPIISLLVFCLGVFIVDAEADRMDVICSFKGKQVRVEGIIVSVRDGNNFLVNVEKLFYRDVDTGYRGELLVHTFETLGFVGGYRITATGILGLAGNDRYGHYLKGIGVPAILEASMDDINITAEKGDPFIYYSSRAASWVRNAIDESFAPGDSEVIKGMLLGGKEAGRNTKRRFSAVGISHLLAVSGLHVGIIAGLLIWLTESIGFLPFIRFLLISCFLIFFSFMTGLTPSVVRASIMAAVVLLAGVVYRKHDALTSLAFTAFLIFAWKPYIIYNISFQLSFMACLGIIAFYPALERIFCHAGKYIGKAAAITVSAQIFLLPIIARNFQIFTPVSVISNLIVIPLSGILLWTSIFFLIFKGLGIPLSIIAVKIGGIIVGMMNFIIDVLQKIPFGSVEVEGISRTAFWGYYAVVVVLAVAVNGMNNERAGC